MWEIKYHNIVHTIYKNNNHNNYYKMAEQKENSLILDKHILLCIGHIEDSLVNNFCGNVFTDIKKFDNHIIDNGTNIYICGDIIKIYQNSREPSRLCSSLLLGKKQ